MNQRDQIINLWRSFCTSGNFPFSRAQDGTPLNVYSPHSKRWTEDFEACTQAAYAGEERAKNIIAAFAAWRLK